MCTFRSILVVLVLAFTLPVHAQLIETSGDPLQMPQEEQPAIEVPPAEVPVIEEVLPPPPKEPVWIDITKVLDQFRIPEKVSNLRAVTVDNSGSTYGFFFADKKKNVYSVYRNGRLMKNGVTESVYDFQKPIVFRMTASGDLLYDIHGTDLYVNSVLVSSGLYNFSHGTTSVHDEGGVLTFPELGNVIVYDVKHDVKRAMYSHTGTIEYLRRRGNTIAYTITERGVSRMYRDGRRVSSQKVDNPTNFALSKEGDVYFFTKSQRGYSLFRNMRSFVTGKGLGGMVDIDPDGHVWHVSYVRGATSTTVKLQKDRSPKNLLPADVANVELSLGLFDGGYAIRGSFGDATSSFFLIRDGVKLGEKFLFEYPYNDTHGFLSWDDTVVLRGFDGVRWRAYIDGQKAEHAYLKSVWFARVHEGELTIYATK